MTSEYVDELEKIGYPELIEFSSLIEGGYYYIHRTCALWSMGIVRDLTTGVLGNVDEVVSQSLSRKCSFCNRYGAHMACKMSCPKYFHLPCVAASGGFQIIQNYTAFCKEHLGQVPLVCTEDINCRACSGLGDVANLMICSLCGDHFHGSCIGVANCQAYGPVGSVSRAVDARFVEYLMLNRPMAVHYTANSVTKCIMQTVYDR